VSETIYQLHQVTKRYEGRSVLDVDGLEVHRGEILALVGPSGAGKSTLLRLLNFLEPPNDGGVQFSPALRKDGPPSGARTGGPSPRQPGVTFDAAHSVPLGLRRRVATVFQRPILLNRSVHANVRYGLRLRGAYDSTHQVEDALEQVGLIDLAHQRAQTLSGGEAQRVSLARAMVLQPDVLLLDEPTANLDPYNVGLIEEIVRSLNDRRGTTIVLVTHNVFQARRLAHRVGLILEGRLIEMAETTAFFESPQDARTAAFVRGEMVY
jgi:tungstate transport system ATP-binding protein